MMAHRGGVILAVLATAIFGGCGRARPEVQAATGREIYVARCALCHGLNREGAPGLYPPLAGSEWVGGPPGRLAAVILDGMRGPVGNYNAVMPGWRGVLRNSEIAAVMTWLRQSEGKSPVTAVEVGHVALETAGRNTFWTAADLQNLRLR
jgi:mono/diheme cytochrome c family protein